MELITRPESPSECGVSECDLETSTMRRPWPTGAVGFGGGVGTQRSDPQDFLAVCNLLYRQVCLSTCTGHWCCYFANPISSFGHI